MRGCRTGEVRYQEHCAPSLAGGREQALDPAELKARYSQMSPRQWTESRQDSPSNMRRESTAADSRPLSPKHASCLAFFAAPPPYRARVAARGRRQASAGSRAEHLGVSVLFASRSKKLATPQRLGTARSFRTTPHDVCACPAAQKARVLQSGHLDRALRTRSVDDSAGFRE